MGADDGRYGGEGGGDEGADEVNVAPVVVDVV